MRSRPFLRILIFMLASLVLTSVEAQCPMCKNAIESGIKNGSGVAKGLNYGILYLMAVPFMSVFTFAYFFWKRAHEKKD
jgi:hypothetical protein